MTHKTVCCGYHHHRNWGKDHVRFNPCVEEDDDENIDQEVVWLLSLIGDMGWERDEVREGYGFSVVHCGPILSLISGLGDIITLEVVLNPLIDWPFNRFSLFII